MRQQPFWVDDHPRPEGLESDLPAEVDVAVVGSGLTGISAALRLAEAGRNVVVVDSGEIASGASSMNGGMVSPDVKAGMRAVYSKHGPDIGREMWAATVRSVEIIIDHTRRYGLDSRIIHGGMTALGLRADSYASFDRQLRWYRSQFGVDWELIGPERINDFVGGSERFKSGLYEPEGIGVQPAGLVFGLAQAAAREGALLVPNCPALSVRGDGSGLVLETAQGRVRTGEVIVATNGYTTAQPVSWPSKRIVAIGSYIIVTEPLSEAEAKTLFPTNSMAYTKRRLLNYVRRTPDNRILIGGRRNLRPGLDLPESAADLHRQLLEFWPSLQSKEISHVWGGSLGVPFDLIPHLKKVDGVWFAMGYGGHGVGLSTLLGHDLAGMILGEDPPSVFTKIPWRGRPYYLGKPWFLTPASVLFRNLDRIGK